MRRALILSGGGGRGAFHVGVWKYLQEIKWQPDLICGTSIGAINAVAIGMGMPVNRLVSLWMQIRRRQVFRRKLLRFIAAAVLGRAVKPMTDTRPLRALLEQNLDVAALRKSPIEILITAVNMVTAKVHIFDQHQITIDHLMASSAMPIIFPWQYIDGQPYWDGGVMANTPLFPALAHKGIDQTVVVTLSPIDYKNFVFPVNVLRACELLFEHFLIGSNQVSTLHEDLLQPANPSVPATARKTSIMTIGPDRMLGFWSLLSYNHRLIRRLIAEGYRTAREQLAHLKDFGK